ncbi:hypothetical protein BD324DRAFT_623453 [Kockovaella imperatae]|uniref:Uncharacterized protein n=1 Tax=Kockovaella imperatae TaxID=4999 RepID=A0A1Y1UL46_9TREE|nr:hypothetical protein BD324DRAFT_623453 [Kockovaella imperatae]ORX37825.1 hypothetical protein BD324DRAFT_623453 [Kockovaella imperatae]
MELSLDMSRAKPPGPISRIHALTCLTYACDIYHFWQHSDRMPSYRLLNSLLLALYGKKCMLVLSYVLTHEPAIPYGQASTEAVSYPHVHQIRSQVHRQGRSLRSRDQTWSLIIPDGGPSEADLINSPVLISPHVAVALYGIVKCNHGWISALMLKAPEEFNVETIVGYMSLYSPEYSRAVLQNMTIETSSEDHAMWPAYFDYALSTFYAGIFGVDAPTDVGGALQAFTGLPTSTYEQDQYTQDSLQFAMDRSNESPVLVLANEQATVLSPGKMYAVKNPSSGSNSTAQLWQAPGAIGEDTVVNASISQLLQDTKSVSHITDFKRWVPMARQRTCFSLFFVTESLLLCQPLSRKLVDDFRSAPFVKSCIRYVLSMK